MWRIEGAPKDSDSRNEIPSFGTVADRKIPVISDHIRLFCKSCANLSIAEGNELGGRQFLKPHRAERV